MTAFRHWGSIVEPIRQIEQVLCGMHSVQLVDFAIVCVEGLWYFARDVLLPTATAWLLVLAAKVTLGAGLARLHDPRVASDLSLLAFGSRVRVVVRNVPFK